MSDKEIVYCYVDGYNLYRAIRNLANTFDKPELIWYDLFKLCEQFLESHQEIGKIYYCSAPYKKYRYAREIDQQKLKDTRLAQAKYCRHHQKTHGKDLFKVKFGYFIKKGPSFEEKQTDVNIALLALDHAHRGFYDRAFILSGDGDLAPIASYVKDIGKGVTFILTPDYASKIIKNLDTRQITGGHISKALFDPGPDAPEPEYIY